MPEKEQDTTVQVSYEVWAALDRRKDRNETMDDVIRKLINNSPVPMGAMKGEFPEPFLDDVVPLADDETPEKKCSHYDSVSNEQCENEPTHKQDYRYDEDEDWSTWYYCDEHRPDTVAELANKRESDA